MFAMSNETNTFPANINGKSATLYKSNTQASRLEFFDIWNKHCDSFNGARFERLQCDTPRETGGKCTKRLALRRELARVRNPS